MIRLLLFILIIIPEFLSADVYSKAHYAYKMGEKTDSIDERAAYFNEALALYSKEEVPSGKLFYNIGNCYYQLGELGLAIWYYHQALKLLPRETQILENLTKAQQAAQVVMNPWQMVERHLFFWNHLLSEKEQTYAFLGLLFVMFIVISAYIWFKRPTLKYLSISFGVLLALLVYKESSWVSRPQKGLFVRPALLRCAPGTEYQTIDETLVPAGQMCKIIEMSKDQEWVKVKTYPHKTGYVQRSLIRIF